jgi:hypothetical protein
MVKQSCVWSSRLIDFELETAFITTDANHGAIPINEARIISLGWYY